MNAIFNKAFGKVLITVFCRHGMFKSFWDNFDMQATNQTDYEIYVGPFLILYRVKK